MTYWFLLGIALACIAVIGVLLFFSGDMSEGVGVCAFVLGILCALGALFSGIEFAVANLDRASCYEQGDKTGMSVQYELLSGCYVRVDNKLIPYDRWVQVSGVNTP